MIKLNNNLTRGSADKVYLRLDGTNDPQDSILFDITGSSLPAEEGRLSWNSDDGTLQVGMPGGNVNLQIGQESLIRVKASEDISNGELVYIDGADGANPTVGLAVASNEAHAQAVIAMATEAITSGQFGYVTTFGLVRDINTISYAPGSVLYLDATTPGAYTDVEPSDPNYSVTIGYVVRQHVTEGTVFNRINQDIWKTTVVQEYLKLDCSNDPLTGVLNTNEDIKIGVDSKKLYLGAGDDYSLEWTGSVAQHTITSGYYNFTGGAATFDGDVLLGKDNTKLYFGLGDDVWMQWNGSSFDLSVDASGVVNFNVDSSGNIHLPNDNETLYFGDSDADSIKHDGTHLLITPETAVRITKDLRIDQHACFDAEFDNGNSSTADTIDWGVGNKQKSTLTDNCTYTFTAPDGVGNFLLKIVQDATGSRTVTWPATVKWPGGTAPTLSTAASSVDIVTFYYDGVNFFGVASLDFQ